MLWVHSKLLGEFLPSNIWCYMLPIIMWSSCFLFNSDPKISTDDLTEELKQHFEAIQSLRDVDDFNKFLVRRNHLWKDVIATSII